jgi:hypothetical protein
MVPRNPYNAGVGGMVSPQLVGGEETRVANDEEFDEELDNGDDLDLDDEDIDLDSEEISLDDIDEEFDDEEAGEDDDGVADDEAEEVEEVADDEAEDADDDLDEEEGEDSLEVLLGTDDVDEDGDNNRGGRSVSKAAATPISEGEFTCRSCFLVKKRAQLADEKKRICLDCA